MVSFSLFGIPITIQPWCWVSLAVIGYNVDSFSSSQGLFKLILFVLAGFISLLIHELGHALTIKKLGAQTEIVLQAFGGFATYPANRFNRWQDFLISAAGPTIQLILGGLILLVWRNIPIDSLGKHFLHVLWVISFVWAIVNLLPIFPLDGGRLLNAILGPKRKAITHAVGLLCAIALAVLALSLQQLFILIFMGFLAYQNFQLFQQARKS